MLELVAFLLPIAAASGWYAAKRHFTRKYFVDHAHPLTRAYCRGLNYLLHEKPDKAIDAFADLLEQDYETIETHIALGNLFRRRGEVEKAIEIHEKLNNDPDLTETLKAHASYELGVDYMRAGLFDRAEAIFQTLSQSESRGKAALQQLLQIYQQEKDWRNAIACTRKLLRFVKPPRGENIAQFLCELAEEALLANSPREAADYLAKALLEDPGCVRASLAKARLELASGNYSEALKNLHRVEQQNPAYLAETLSPTAECYESLGDNEGLMHHLARLYRDFGLIAAAIALAERIHRKGAGPRAAAEYLLSVMEARPRLLGLSAAVDLLSVPGQRLERSDMERVSAGLSRLVQEIPRYRCRECGFSGSQLHWRCPSCQSWDSVTPV